MSIGKIHEKRPLFQEVWSSGVKREMSLSANVNEKASLIWAISDKLTGVYKPHEYGEVILPLTVIRRL